MGLELSLEAALRCHAADQMLLPEVEDDQHRHDHQHREDHNQVEAVVLAFKAFQGVQSERQSPELLVWAQVNQRIQEVIPGG